MRHLLRALLLSVISLGWLGSSVTNAQPRKDLRLLSFETELILETGARTAAADVLLFTPDGKRLLAAGDDKVVRAWPFDPVTGLDRTNLRTLRWSIYRQQRGSIYAAALDRKAERIAVAGWGIRNGSVSILDLKTGETLDGIIPANNGKKIPRDMTTIWALAFSPSGKQVAIGAADGRIFVWEPGTEQSFQLLGTHPGGTRGPNIVRFVHFAGENELLSVAADGHVLEWNVAQRKSRQRFRFDERELFGVVLDPSGKWLAAFSATPSKMSEARVEIRSLQGENGPTIKLPRGRYPRCVAFNPKKQQLAVGYYTEPIASFYKITGGGISLYDLSEREPRPEPGPPNSYYPEVLTFHPDGKHLAVAGGQDHEVEVWTLNPLTLTTRILGQGRCLWGVAFSPDGRFLGYRNQREVNPASPNEWGKGEWNVFDLKDLGWAKPPQQQAFQPLRPLERANGWSVLTDTKKSAVWEVKGPNGEQYALPLQPEDFVPRCYTFLEGRPTRLVIGHYWGMSVFELGAKKARLVRKFVGHQGEVMSVAASKDSKLLVTASRDQTIVCWRMDPWLYHPELGARFRVVDKDTLEIVDVDPGSPAWEARMLKGDQIVMMMYATKPVAGGAEVWQQTIENLEPGREIIVDVKRAGEARPVRLLTTVRQRPLWGFFPQQNKEWILWRHHGYYYDCSTNGDFSIGWQLSGENNATPRFDRAEQYRARFQRRDKLVGFLPYPKDVERVSLLEELAPKVVLAAESTRVRNQPATIDLTVSASGEDYIKKAAAVKNQERRDLDRVLIWVNDHMVQEWQGPKLAALMKEERFRTEYKIPVNAMRTGKNIVTVQAFSREQCRNDQQLEIEMQRPPTPPTLYTLAIGVGDYSQVKLANLSANKDAEALNKLIKAHTGKLFSKVDDKVLQDDQATKANVIREIQRIAKLAQPDDMLVMFLGGHGTSDSDLKANAGQRGIGPLKERLEPNTFIFCTSNINLEKPATTALTGQEIYEALAQVTCRKVLLLDACHSGTVGLDPVRSVTPSAVGPVILSACAPDQLATESKLLGALEAEGRAQGLFAIAMILAFEDDFDKVDGDIDPAQKNGKIDAEELSHYLVRKVPQLLKRISPRDEQDPRAFLPKLEKRLDLAEK